jgi:hypothetical protein
MKVNYMQEEWTPETNKLEGIDSIKERQDALRRETRHVLTRVAELMLVM